MSLTPSSAGFSGRHTARTSPRALLLVGLVMVGAASGARAEQSSVAARVLADLERERQKETEAARRRASNLRGGSEPADLGGDHDVADAAALRRCLIFGEDRLDFFARAHLVAPYADPLLATDVADAGLTPDVVDHLVQARVLLRTVPPAEVRVRDDRAPASEPLPDGMPVELVASSCLAGHVIARVGGVGVVALPRDAVGTVADWQQRLCSRARALPAAGPGGDGERHALVHQLAAATRGLPPAFDNPRLSPAGDSVLLQGWRNTNANALTAERFVVTAVATVRAAPRSDGAVVARLGPGLSLRAVDEGGSAAACVSGFVPVFGAFGAGFVAADAVRAAPLSIPELVAARDTATDDATRAVWAMELAFADPTETHVAEARAAFDLARRRAATMLAGPCDTTPSPSCRGAITNGENEVDDAAARLMPLLARTPVGPWTALPSLTSSGEPARLRSIALNIDRACACCGCGECGASVAVRVELLSDAGRPIGLRSGAAMVSIRPPMAWDRPVDTSVCEGIDAVVRSSPAFAASAISSEELRDAAAIGASINAYDGPAECLPDGAGGAWWVLHVGDCGETSLDRAFHVRGGRVVATAPLVATTTNGDGSKSACTTASPLPQASRDGRGRYRVTATGVPWPPPKPAAKAAKVAP
jgi:hypothetical protein